MNGSDADSRERLTLDEISFCVQACAFLHLPRSPPDYFRDYLAEMAEDERPPLAAKLRLRTNRDLADLYEYVRDLQAQMR